MSGIAVEKMSVHQIHDSQEKCHEHTAVIRLRHQVIDRSHDLRRVVFMGGERPEQASGHSHDQRSGNAFSADIADTEEEFIIPDIKIIQITSDFLCRGHHGTKIDFAAIRERRENLGNNRHLDPPRYLQFPFNTSFGFRCVLQLIHVFLHGLLHRIHRIPEHIQLVLGFDFGEAGVEITAGDAFRCLTELQNRTRQTPQQEDTDAQ